VPTRSLADSGPGGARPGFPRFHRVKVLRRLPHPDRGFTQGLLAEGDTVWESTGNYGQSALRRYRLGQPQIISAITSNNGDFAGVWAPNMYTLAEKGGAKLLCSGFDAGAVVPGALVARPDFAKEKPDLVAKYLAVYLRAWAWIKAHPKEAREMMKTFYAQGGVEI